MRKFLGVEDLRLASYELAKSYPKMVIAGGAAMVIYGSDRLTMDLDVLSSRTPSGLRPKSRLPFGGFSMMVGKVPVDVIVRDDELKSLYAAAIHGSMTSRACGWSLPVVRAMYLVVIKLASGRAKDEQDLLFLLSRMTKTAREEVLLITRKYLGIYAVDEMRSRILEADWMRSGRGRDARPTRSRR